jgi:hypothetical protein
MCADVAFVIEVPPLNSEMSPEVGEPVTVTEPLLIPQGPLTVISIPAVEAWTQLPEVSAESVTLGAAIAPENVAPAKRA